MNKGCSSVTTKILYLTKFLYLMEASQVKTLRLVCAATILSVSVVISASAGDLHAPGVASTQTSTTSVTTSVILTIVSLIFR